MAIHQMEAVSFCRLIDVYASLPIVYLKGAVKAMRSVLCVG